MKAILLLPILIGLGGSFLFPYRVSGRIVGSHGEPVAMASVVHWRSGKQVLSDARGRFAMEGVKSFDRLAIQTPGYHPLEVNCNERGQLLLRLHPILK